jgi:hypothetical protein
MRKIYLLLLMLGLFLMSPEKSAAQDLPWPDLGEPMLITPGAPGTINQTINGDVDGSGNRLHNHYVLQRGQTYLYTARIENDGWPLMVTAEEGDGPLPIIKPLGPAAGQDEAERPFHAPGDLYLKDIVISGWDQGGNYTDNAPVRLAADSITVVLDNVVFDFNRQQFVRINAVGCKLYIENCIFGNAGVSQRFQQGMHISFRGNWTPIVHLKNNTFYNGHYELLNNMNTKRYQKLVMENNTIMNTGQGGADFGRPDTLIVEDNLWVNVGIMGDAILGNRERFVEPFYYLSLDSNFTDTTNTTLLHPYVEFNNNHFYLDPAIAELLPDSANKSTESLFHPYLADLIGENNEIIDEAFTFESFPATTAEYQAYIMDFYTFADEPAQMPLFTTDFRTLDFSYDETHPAYSAASDGGPLGDRNWFPDYIPTGISDIVKGNFLIYPNPVHDVLHVNLRPDQRVDKVVLTNIVGQQVKTVVNRHNTQLSVPVNDLQSGIYFVSFYNNNRLTGVNKLIKK